MYIYIYIYIYGEAMNDREKWRESVRDIRAPSMT